MKEDVLKPKGKTILLGNEAIVRGALESGIGLAASYPGTPSSEIGQTFSEIAKEAGIYFEYATNEKVATEVAAGAAFAGVRSMTSMKHFGMNVASDSILPIVYHSVKGGMIIVCADDPGCHSSGQSEQDSRFFARMGHIPVLEPSDPQDCKDFVKFGYKISEKFRLPIILRTTTRVSHASGIVKLDPIIKGKTIGKYTKDYKTRNMPPDILCVHEELNMNMDKLKKITDLNKIIPGKGKIGVITTGVAFCHVMEALERLDLKIPIFKLGMTNPLPEEQIKKFLKELETAIVVEELEPIMEQEISFIAQQANIKTKIIGKNHLPGTCELNQEIVTLAFSEIFKIKIEYVEQKEIKTARRLPTFCPGCPHRASFWSVKQSVPPETVLAGDIGCYILGIYPPTQMEDFVISMGAAQGIAHGIAKSTQQKPVSFIGDSTFFHAGIPALVNDVFNKANSLLIALDNRWTAMTGHQPNPTTGITAMGEPTKALRIEDVGRACGVDNVVIANCYNLRETTQKIKDAYAKPGTSLLVSKGECRLQYMRRSRKEGFKVPIFEIDQKKCIRCNTCVEKYACPAIEKEKDGKVFIDPSLCWGCSACSQVCPVSAISARKET
ncbi:MAG: indolepyruvate ferredoxin oxidoreductase subunit alpha [Candidatus Woesearchaeota archaeon]